MVAKPECNPHLSAPSGRDRGEASRLSEQLRAHEAVPALPLALCGGGAGRLERGGRRLQCQERGISTRRACEQGRALFRPQADALSGSEESPFTSCTACSPEGFV